MPQHINAPITNSPYHGQITETDEGLMELRPDMQQPMYGGAFSKVRSGTSPSEDVQGTSPRCCEMIELIMKFDNCIVLIVKLSLSNHGSLQTLPRRLHEHQHELAPPQKFHTMQRGMTGIPPGYNPQM